MKRAWRAVSARYYRPRLRELVILSMPRTGTSYFSDCLSGLPGTVVPREVFNPRGYVPLLRIKGARSRFERILGEKIRTHHDEHLNRFFVDRPLEAIDTLADLAAERRARLLVYKVINHQLSRPALETVLSSRRPEVIIMVRQRLAVSVSAAKAQAVGKWHHVDTQNVGVEIDIDRFLNRFREVDDWYEFVLNMTNRLGLRVRILDYDTDVDRPPEELRIAARQWLEGLTVRLPLIGSAKFAPRERQDARTDPFSKISNGDALRDELIARNMLDYALSPPLAERLSSNRLD